MSISSRIVRNSAFAAFGRIWTAATTFFVWPYMLRVLTEEGVGVWQLFLRIGLLLAIIDLGVAPALVKYVAEYAARGDTDRLNTSINSAVLFQLVLSAVVLVAGLLLTDAYLTFIKTPPELFESARYSFRWVVAVTALMLASAAFKPVLIGMQRLDIVSTIEVVVSLPILAATVWVLVAADTPSEGLRGMGVVQFSQYATISLAIAWYAIKLLPTYHVNFRDASMSSLRGLLGYGWRASLCSMNVIVHAQAEWFLLARYLGPGTVGLYAFGAKMVDVWKNAVSPAFSTIVSAASAMNAQEGPDRLRKFYEQGTKLMLAVMHPIGIWLIAIAPIFMTAWMGMGYGMSMMAMRYLALAAIAWLSAGVALSIARGVGILKPEMVATTVLAVSELVLGILVGPVYGYRGLLTVSVVAVALYLLVSVALIHRAMGIPFWSSLFRIYVPPFLLATIAGIPLMWYNHLLREEIVHAGLMNDRVLYLGAMGLVETILFFGAYLVFLRLSSYVTPAEFRALRQAIQGAKSSSTSSGRSATVAATESES